MFRRGKRAKRTLGLAGRPLRFESLESKCLLAGTVDVVFAAGVLSFNGDADPNNVRVTAGANPGELNIEGIDTTINGPTMIVAPIDRIEVELNGGSDTFSIEGQSTSNQVLITGEVEIINEDGANTNRFINAFLSDTLTLLKQASVSESTLEIEGTTIVGVVTVDNNDGGEGATKTRIIGDSHLQNDLIIDNGAGQDILVVFESQIDGNVTISNGDGDTRTVFGIEEDPIVFGDLTITNGNGNDKVFLHDTSVWGDVDIDNGDGHTLVDIENTHLGLGAPVGAGNTLEIDNGDGFDQLRISDSTFRNHVDVDNGAGTYGSSVEIVDESVLGNDFRFSGDNGREIITIDSSRVVDDVDLDLFDGGSEVVVTNSEIGEKLSIDADNGSDTVRIDEATEIGGDVHIDLGGGIDLLQVLAMSRLLGSSSFEGGAGVDTFERDLDITIAFMALETFEIDVFNLP